MRPYDFQVFASEKNTLCVDGGGELWRRYGAPSGVIPAVHAATAPSGESVPPFGSVLACRVETPEAIAAMAVLALRFGGGWDPTPETLARIAAPAGAPISGGTLADRVASVAAWILGGGPSADRRAREACCVDPWDGIDWETAELSFDALMGAHPHAARLIERWYAGGPVAEGRHDDYEGEGADPSEMWQEPDWPEEERYFVGADWHAYFLTTTYGSVDEDVPICLRSPDPLPTRTGRLVRGEDVTGVSGTGHVADITATLDGRGALVTWLGDWPTAVWHLRGVASVERLHGHDGRTRIVWDTPTQERRALEDDPILPG